MHGSVVFSVQLPLLHTGSGIVFRASGCCVSSAWRLLESARRCMESGLPSDQWQKGFRSLGFNLGFRVQEGS